MCTKNFKDNLNHSPIKKIDKGAIECKLVYSCTIKYLRKLTQYGEKIKQEKEYKCRYL